MTGSSSTAHTDPRPLGSRPTSGDRRRGPDLGTDLPQYSHTRIIATWAAAAVPMAALAWIGAPAIAGAMDGADAWPKAIVLSLTAGLLWQFVLVLLLVHREQGSLRWPVLRSALWLRPPQSPRNGRRGGRLWLVVVPLVAGVAAKEELPKMAAPFERDQAAFLQSVAGQEFFSGNWTWFALLVIMMIFNTVLGEELLFRGLLLPRMQQAFGRWDWVANGVLFGLYHLHVPWTILPNLLDTFLLSWPARRFRSALVGIAVHSAQTVVFTALLLRLVLS